MSGFVRIPAARRDGRERQSCANFVEELDGLERLREPLTFSVILNLAAFCAACMRGGYLRRFSCGQCCQWWRPKRQLGQFAKILGGGSQGKFVTRTGWTSQSEAVELQNALEVSEQHFDLLPIPARLPVCGRFSDASGNLTRGFVHAADDFAHRLAGTAFLLKGA